MRPKSTGLPGMRGLLAGVLGGVLLATGLSAPALAAPVSVDDDVLATQLFAGLADVRFDGDLALARAAAVSADFVEWRRLHPVAALGAAQAELSAELQLVDGGLTAVDKQQDEAGLLMQAIDLLSAAGASPARSSAHIRAMVEGLVGSAVGLLDNRENLTEGALSNLAWQRSRSEVMSSLWADVRHTAQADPVFAQAWNTALGGPAAMDATASLDQLKAADELRGKLDLGKILSLTDDPAAFEAEVRAQAGAVFAGLTAVATTVNTEAGKQAAKCPAVTPPGPGCTADNQTEAEKKDKEFQGEADEFNAALKAIHPLLRPLDPQFAEQVQVIGEAMINTVRAVSKYAADISKIADVGGKIFSMAALTMTGNVFGAVMSVVGLFGASKPDISKMILDQVKVLQKEVKDLHKEMTASFKRVDTRLDSIYNTMAAEFNRLSAEIAGNAAQLVLLQQNVAQLGLRLEEVTASILTAIGQSELVGVRTSIDKYIGYAEQFGMPIPTFSPDYVGAETDLHLASTQLAEDAAFTVPAAGADDPSLDPTVILNSNGETRSINYLAKHASRRDSAIAPPTAPVGNAGVWALGAQGYALLQLQNPGYARQVNSSRADGILVDGQRVLDTAASFAHPVGAPDANGNYRNGLFKSLDADYRAGVQNLSVAMGAIRTDLLARYEPNADGVQTKTPKSYDMFWNGTSTPASPPPVPADPANLPRCSPTGGPKIARPASVSYGSLPNQVKFLNYAYTSPSDEVRELPELSMCYAPTYVGVREAGIDPLTGEQISRGKLRLDVYTRYRINPDAGWQNVVDTGYTWPQERRIDGLPVTDLFAKVWNIEGGWDDFRDGARSTVDSSVLSSATTTVKQFLTIRQKLLYENIGTALATPATPAATAVKQMNAARRLLQAYTQLGLPIALQSDPPLLAMLAGQHKLLGDLSTEPTLTDAVRTASNNYNCSPDCSTDPARPILNQTFYETSDAPCAAASRGPGDPLGNCLVEHALRRADTVKTRLEVHFKQLSVGDYREQLPSISTALRELKVADRISHQPPVTAGLDRQANTTGQAVSLDLNQHTSGGKTPYTYTAANLPAGLTLGADGVIQGGPTTNGTSIVTITARDANGLTGNAYTFKWTVGVANVPDLKGLSWNLAKTAITHAGLSVGSLASRSDCTKPFGTVDSQTPAANTDVAAGTTASIVYTVCSGDAPALASPRPSEGGVTLIWTDKSINEDDFVVSRYSSTGQFVSQAGSRPSGSKLRAGSEYTFTDSTPNANAPCYKVEAHLAGDDIVLASALGCPAPVIGPVAANGAPLAVARLADGRLVSFAAGGGALAHRTQITAGASDGWGPWTEFGNPPAVTLTSLAAAANGGDNVEVFGVTSTGEIWHRWQTSATAWSSWTLVDGLLDSIAVARNAAGMLEIFGTNAQGQAYHRTQQTTGRNDWSNWDQITGINDLHSITAAKDQDGRLEAMAADSQGKTYLRWQTSPGGPWSGWDTRNGAATQLSMVGNADGHLEAFGTNRAGAVSQIYQLAPNGTTGWTGWNPAFGTTMVGVTAGFTDNRVQVFAVTATGELQSRWQLAGGGWSDWTAW